MFCINSGYSKSAELRDLLLELFSILSENGAAMSADYLPGSKNVVADSLSRTAIGDNW
jgi:hypothetical protein